MHFDKFFFIIKLLLNMASMNYKYDYNFQVMVLCILVDF